MIWSVSKTVLPLALAMSVLAVTVSIARAGSPMGQLEMRVTDHKPGIDQFRSLDVTLASVALHERGKGRHEGWIDIAGQTEAIDIVPLKDGLFVSLGMQEVPTAAYDAVALRFAAVDGRLKTDKELSVWHEDAIVRIDLAITEQENAPLVIDLYAEDQTEHDPPRYVVKVKEVRLAK